MKYGLLSSLYQGLTREMGTPFFSLPYFILLPYLNLLIKKTLKTPFDFSFDFLDVINLFDHSSFEKNNTRFQSFSSGLQNARLLLGYAKISSNFSFLSKRHKAITVC